MLNNPKEWSSICNNPQEVKGMLQQRDTRERRSFHIFAGKLGRGNLDCFGGTFCPFPLPGEGLVGTRPPTKEWNFIFHETINPNITSTTFFREKTFSA